MKKNINRREAIKSMAVAAGVATLGITPVQAKENFVGKTHVIYMEDKEIKQISYSCDVTDINDIPREAIKKYPKAISVYYSNKDGAFCNFWFISKEERTVDFDNNLGSMHVQEWTWRERHWVDEDVTQLTLPKVATFTDRPIVKAVYSIDTKYNGCKIAKVLEKAARKYNNNEWLPIKVSGNTLTISRGVI